MEVEIIIHYSSEYLRPSLRKIGLKQTDISEKLPRNGYTNNQERILRVLSWLTVAQNSQRSPSDLDSDHDVCLMCAWVAFNGLYEQAHKRKETDVAIECIIKKLIGCDKKHVLSEYLRKNKDRSMEILRNEYLCYDYWKGKECDKWKDYSDGEIEGVLANPCPNELLTQIMLRIKELRNQLMHGGAGYNDYYNRWQIEACAKFLWPLVSRMLSIMIDSVIKDPDTLLWGTVPWSPQTDKPKTSMGEYVDKVKHLESESGQSEK